MLGLGILALVNCASADEADPWWGEEAWQWFEGEGVELEFRRGWRWQKAWLSVRDRAGIYAAVARQMRAEALEWYQGDTASVPAILVAPDVLPPEAIFGDGENEPERYWRMNAAVLRALVNSEGVSGMCTIENEGPFECKEGVPGIALAFSPIYRTRAGTVKVYVAQAQFAKFPADADSITRSGEWYIGWTGSSRYCLVRRPAGWTVVCDIRLSTS